MCSQIKGGEMEKLQRFVMVGLLGVVIALGVEVIFLVTLLLLMLGK